jgi:hypothetical protein
MIQADLMNWLPQESSEQVDILDRRNAASPMFRP